MPLTADFFNQDTRQVAKALLGKVLRVKHEKTWLSAQIIETEAYYLTDKASHASLGYTEKRKALFMSPGTIYMYHSRAGASLNVSTQGQGNAVLIKSAIPYTDDLFEQQTQTMLSIMQQLNPKKNGELRDPMRLLSGQALLCRALKLAISDWNGQSFDQNRFYLADVNNNPTHIITTTRLGIAVNRDPDLPYRFIDPRFIHYCTKKPKKTQTF